jgi:SAM-dependent methyltransferase
MSFLQDWLSSLTPCRVLDLATGSGGFIHFLLQALPSETEIIGLDNNERTAAAFAATFSQQPNVRFQFGDAQTLNFAPASFDLVTISNSFHHFQQPQAVLEQALGVLKSGGHLLIAEMYCDAQTETQQTHVLLHHWWAAVDRTHGICHQPTFTRQELLAQASSLGLTDLRLHDECDLQRDPQDPALLAELDSVFERYLQRAEGHPALQAEGQALRQRVQTIGFHSATTLFILGKKP